jgi:hypothetical protein
MGSIRSRAAVRAAAMALGLALVGLVGLVGLAPPAAAADLPVSGPFTGTGHFEFACTFAQEYTDGSGDLTSLGPSTFHLEYCVEPTPDLSDPWPVTSGTFTVDTATGTLTGDVGGHVNASTAGPDGRYPIHLVLSITGGTEGYEGATGSLTLDAGLEYIPFFDRRYEGTVSGTVTLPPSTPASRDDCRHGGWRDLVDDQGRPFRNQGDCIAWVSHHGSG